MEKTGKKLAGKLPRGEKTGGKDLAGKNPRGKHLTPFSRLLGKVLPNFS